MAKDLFSGLGGLVKGLSDFMPQDNPAIKALNAQSEVSSLEKQAEEIYAEIGRQAYARNPDAWPQKDKLRLIESNLVSAQQQLNEQKREQEEAERIKADANAALTCPSCAHLNPEGVKFCQECGTKLGGEKVFCTGCGQEQVPGTRFCGTCGAQIG